MIELHVFVPATDGAHDSMLQEDDGLTFAALDGARYRTTFTVTRRANTVTIEARVDGDGYPEFSRQAFHLVVHGATPAAVILDGEQLDRGDDGFVIPNSGQDFTAAFDA